MLPVRLAGRFKKAKLVYDAHEYFSQQKEIITRPRVYRVWKWIEKTFVPKFKNGYTVSQSIAAEFKKLYGVDYEVIRNMPVLTTLENAGHKEEKIIIYQGAVNEARGLEFLIPAMETIDATLHIYGDGNFMQQTNNLITSNNLKHKVFLKGKLLPDDLDEITQSAYIGINLVEHLGLNQYYSLANKYFDYIQHGLPQVSMNFPEYKKINDEFDVAILIDDQDIETTRNAIKRLLEDKVLYNRLQQNCLKARQVLNWQQEEKKLIQFYKNLLG
jgi:glycosyltransferase involved in cell wall biosynthesis